MRTIAVAVIMLGGFPAVTLAQAPADFSGRWAIEVAPPPSAATAPGGAAARPDQAMLGRGDMSSGWGSPLTITQDGKQLIVEQALFSRYDIQAQPRFVYALDGTETRTEVMTGHATQVRSSRAQWVGQSLQIVTKYPGIDPGTGKPFSMDVTYKLTLESPTAMVIETTRAAALGGAAVTTRTTYRKS